LYAQNNESCAPSGRLLERVAETTACASAQVKIVVSVWGSCKPCFNEMLIASFLRGSGINSLWSSQSVL